MPININIPGLGPLQGTVEKLIDSLKQVNSAANPGEIKTQIDALKEYRLGQQATSQQYRLLISQLKTQMADVGKRSDLYPALKQKSQVFTAVQQTAAQNALDAGIVLKSLTGMHSNAKADALNEAKVKNAMEEALLNTGPTLSAQSGARLGSSIMRALNSGNPSSSLSTLAVGAGLGPVGLALSAITAGISSAISALKISMGTALSSNATYFGGGRGSAVDTKKIQDIADLIGIDESAVSDMVRKIGGPAGFGALEPRIRSIITAKSDREASIIAESLGLPELAKLRRKKDIVESVLNNKDSMGVSQRDMDRAELIDSAWNQLKRSASQTITNIVGGALEHNKKWAERLGGITTGGKPDDSPETKLKEAAKELKESADSIKANSQSNKMYGSSGEKLDHALPGAWGWYDFSNDQTELARSMGPFRL